MFSLLACLAEPAQISFGKWVLIFPPITALITRTTLGEREREEEGAAERTRGIRYEVRGSLEKKKGTVVD